VKEIVAYCGLVCHSCPILLATREKNREKRDKMRADITVQIREHYGMEYGRMLFSGCSTCQIRKCAREKSIENCAHCYEYACERLEKFFVTDPEARKRLDAIRGAL
jgi:hypothetical protein